MPLNSAGWEMPSALNPKPLNPEPQFEVLQLFWRIRAVVDKIGLSLYKEASTSWSLPCRTFRKLGGALFWGPYTKDPTIQGTILGSIILGNPHSGESSL